MKELVLASNNQGKLTEFQQLLAPCALTVHPQSAFATPDIEETGLSFVENAILKARNASSYSQLPALADDSGLEVDALQGKPGIYSARFSGEGATDEKNNKTLLTMLEDIPEAERSARFQCVLVLMLHPEDPSPKIYQGTWEGRILFTPQGDNGFGYDPLFYIEAFNCSSAQLAAQEKNAMSHRGQAIQKFLADCS